MSDTQSLDDAVHSPMQLRMFTLRRVNEVGDFYRYHQIQKLEHDALKISKCEEDYQSNVQLFKELKERAFNEHRFRYPESDITASIWPE